MIRLPIALSAVLALLLVALPGCDTVEGQDLFFEQSELDPRGFTETGEDGEVVSEDPDDWRVAPFFANQVDVRPASPNPVARNGLVTLTVQDIFGTFTGELRLSGIGDGRQFVLLDEDAGPDFYTFTFNPTRLRISSGEGPRLYRVRVLDSQSRIVTYGDILVQ